MAGIGFELRRMIDERQGFLAKVRAYSCAGLISSGPWLMTILTLTLLNLAGPYLGGTTGYSLFRALVTYAFAFSLILQGIGQMAITRRVADLLYSHQYERVLPAFAASLLITGVVHAAIGLGFCLWAGFAPSLACLATTLFTIIGMTWIALIWLSIVRQYDDVLRAYIYGTLVAMVGVVFLMLGRGTTGILAAYTAGQAFTLVMLVRTIVRGMESSGGRDFTVFGSFKQFPRLVLVGLFYNAAIWIDKMIFWFRDGIGPHDLIRYHPLYDTCSFLAYLTVVPALAVNLVRLETSFYEKYRGYYGAILGGTPLSVIEDKKAQMIENLREGIVRLLRVQGAITVLCIVFAPFMIRFLELPLPAIKIFRLTCLGALFHVFLLITILMQLYFDLRAQAMATSLVFFGLNGALAWWSVTRGVDSYGVGYALAAFLSLLLGYTLLHQSLERLDYMTFTNQSIDSITAGAPDPVPEKTQEQEETEEAEEEEETEKQLEHAAVQEKGQVSAPKTAGLFPPVSPISSVDAPSASTDTISVPDADAFETEPVLLPVAEETPEPEPEKSISTQEELETLVPLPKDPFADLSAIPSADPSAEARSAKADPPTATGAFPELEADDPSTATQANPHSLDPETFTQASGADLSADPKEDPLTETSVDDLEPQRVVIDPEPDETTEPDADQETATEVHPDGRVVLYPPPPEPEPEPPAQEEDEEEAKEEAPSDTAHKLARPSGAEDDTMAD